MLNCNMRVEAEVMLCPELIPAAYKQPKETFITNFIKILSHIHTNIGIKCLTKIKSLQLGGV